MPCCALQLQLEQSWVRWVDEAFFKLDVNSCTASPSDVL